jgi:hypothetical protein
LVVKYLFGDVSRETFGKNAMFLTGGEPSATTPHPRQNPCGIDSTLS